MPPIPERLATLEAEVKGLGNEIAEVKGDVKEVRKDVKSLLLRDASSSGVLAFIQKSAPWAAMLVAAYAALTK